MFEQYEQLKSQHRDAILLFRLGDFYEMFGEDAREGSRLLGLTLTKRQSTPMCGVPHHAAHSYIGRLLKVGKKVAVCEQTGPVTGRSLTRREVVEVISPGAVFDPDFLDPRQNNYILAIGAQDRTLSMAWIDASVGELEITASEFTDDDEREALIRAELARLDPAELLVQESLLERSDALTRVYRAAERRVVNRIPDWAFGCEESFRRLRERFSVVNLRGFGIEEGDQALYCAATILDYLEENARHVLDHLGGVRRRRFQSSVQMDEATIRNLELVANMHDGGRDYSLIDVLDRCRTAVGSRLLRRWVLAPERDFDEILDRQNAVERLYRTQHDLQTVRSLLNDVYDVERLIGRLGVARAHAKDLAAIAASISTAVAINHELPDWVSGPGTTGLMDDEPEWRELDALCKRITETLADDPPIMVGDGGVIRPGFDQELDHLRSLHDHSSSILDDYLEEQRNSTGIATLRLRFNRVLGYFFEVTKNQAGRMPEYFIRRQTLTSGERFTTERLNEIEIQIAGAGDAAIAREEILFAELRDEVSSHIPVLAKLARRIGRLDAIASLAQVATDHAWVRPKLVTESVIRMRRGRHPVVEAHIPPGEFVPNDLVLEESDRRFALITGPNMAGKSTVLRQTALIVLIAQIGGFVPVDEVELAPVDRIFCRVGASDNIARGESTFLVEMNETSNILRNATTDSLVIMDEVGRGTSTHDGLAIAWAVCEFLLTGVRARTLFATHYHELTAIKHAAFLPLTMAVDHSGATIIFLKRLVEGAADKSYGIDVARMAGIPEPVLTRATAVLASLERRSPTEAPAPAESVQEPPQSELFSERDLILSELETVDPEAISPREALNMLFRWQGMVTTQKTRK